MPTNIHRAVIATMQSFQVEEDFLLWFDSQPKEMQKLFCISEGPLHNGFQSVIMVPEGSGEFRPACEEAKIWRVKFINFLEKHTCSWVCVEYGDVDSRIFDSGDM